MADQYNAADEDGVKAARMTDAQRRRQELADIKAMVETPAGRRVYWRWLSECGVFKSSFRQSSEIYFLEGRRSIGLNLLADLMEAKPEAYLLMVSENQQK